MRLLLLLLLLSPLSASATGLAITIGSTAEIYYSEPNREAFVGFHDTYAAGFRDGWIVNRYAWTSATWEDLECAALEPELMFQLLLQRAKTSPEMSISRFYHELLNSACNGL